MEKQWAILEAKTEMEMHKNWAISNAENMRDALNRMIETKTVNEDIVHMTSDYERMVKRYLVAKGAYEALLRVTV